MGRIEQVRGELPAWPGLEQAMDDVRAHNAAHGTEKCVVLDRMGRTVYEQVGEEHIIRIPPDIVTSGIFKDTFFVHNHPMSAPLSYSDMKTGALMEVAGIMAVLPEEGKWDAIMLEGVDWAKVTPTLFKADQIYDACCMWIEGTMFGDGKREIACPVENWTFLQAARTAWDWRHRYPDTLVASVERFMASTAGQILEARKVF